MLLKLLSLYLKGFVSQSPKNFYILGWFLGDECNFSSLPSAALVLQVNKAAACPFPTSGQLLVMQSQMKDLPQFIQVLLQVPKSKIIQKTLPRCYLILKFPKLTKLSVWSSVSVYAHE